jgi:hypothetical protein
MWIIQTLNPLQLPLIRGRAKPNPPLTRAGWEGLGVNGQSKINPIKAHEKHDVIN